MKLLLIHQIFVAPQEAGGTRHFELGRYCAERGDEFLVLASDVSYLSGQAAVGRPRWEEFDGVRVRWLRMPQWLHRSFLSRVVCFLYFMVKSIFVGIAQSKNVDVVIGTTPPLFQAFSALVVAKFRRRPLVLEVRDLWPDFAVDMGILNSKVLIALARWLERLLYRNAAHIVVNSPAYIDHIVAKGVERSRITLVPNGVDAEMFDPDAQGEHVRSRYDLQDKFVVTYAGAIGPANDLPTVVSAAELLRHDSSVHILIVGDGKNRSQVEAQAEQLGLTNITFAGALPKNEMPEVLAASDACLAILMNIPMFSMTYPNKVFDYMAAGRPTILAIDGVIREVVEAAEAGIFVEPGNPQAICDAVVRLKGDSEERLAMGRSARAYVGEHFDRREQAKLFRELLHAIATDGTFDADAAMQTPQQITAG